MKRNRYLEIGTISEGTLREEDLLPAYLDALGGIRLSRRDRKEVTRIRAIYRKWERSEKPLSDFLDYEVTETLPDLLDAYCPTYCYFGSLEGDGSCLGVWPDLGSIEFDREAGDLPDAEKVPKGYTGLAVEISDHGNCTLFSYTRGRRRVLWSVV